jgi:hypothetical protein
VNETQGSYFVIEMRAGEFYFSFYTSGLFNMYGIKRQSLVKFCDRDGDLRIIGLGGRDEKIMIVGEGLILGDPEAKSTFHQGPAPELLKRLHELH